MRKRHQEVRDENEEEKGTAEERKEYCKERRREGPKRKETIGKAFWFPFISPPLPREAENTHCIAELGQREFLLC